MTLKKIFMQLFLCILISFPVCAGESPSIKGVYETLKDHEYTFDGKKVEIVEFLSFYCSHCYQFERTVPVIRGNFPNKIKWRIAPIYWGNGSSKPGEAYFLALEQGKGDQMKKALFEAFFEDKKNIGDISVLEELGMKLGLGFDFSRRLRAGDKQDEVARAFADSKAYGIDATPTLIIAGNLKTIPSKHSNLKAYRDNIITILRSILRK